MRLRKESKQKICRKQTVEGMKTKKENSINLLMFLEKEEKLYSWNKSKQSHLRRFLIH